MSSSATSAEVAFEARAACASLIACCATAVALSRIDCGSEGFELTSVSNERAVCRRTTADAKDIQFRNDFYKDFPKLYHVFVLLSIPRVLRHPPPPCYHSRMPSERIQSRIIELCSEDAYGSWELWWSLGAKKAEERDTLCDRFIVALQGLLN